MATAHKHLSVVRHPSVLSQAAALREAGLAVHWLHPKSKRPIGKGWSEAPVVTAEQLQTSYRAEYNLGVRLGEPSRLADGFLYVIDMDIRVPEMADEAWAAFAKLFPGVAREDLPEVASGSGGESRHLYFISDQPFRSKMLAHSDGKHRHEVVDPVTGNKRFVWSWDWEAELFGSGKQTVLPPSIHPDTGKPYRWVREFDFDAFEQPFISAALIESLGAINTDTFEFELRDPLTFEPGQLEAELDLIPVSELHYNEWVKLGQALHHQFGGAQEGLDLWEKHSRRSTKFGAKKTPEQQLREMRRSKWPSFGKWRGKPVTMATVRRWYLAERDVARADEWVADLDDLPDDPAEEVVSHDNDFDALLYRSRPGDDSVFTTGDKEESGAAAVARINRKHAVISHGGKTLVIIEKPNGAVEFSSVHDFTLFYENDRRIKPGSKAGDNPDRYESVAKFWMRQKGRRQYEHGVVFAPGGGPDGALNLWKGWAVAPDRSASCALFLDHVREVISRGNAEHADYVFGWMAHLVQRPEEKPGVALILRGLKGTGKDTVGEYLAAVIGRRHVPTVSDPKHITGNFNRHFESALLLHVQEGAWAGDHRAESVIKYLVTSETVQIERKGIDSFSLDSFMRILISSNADWTVPASFDERRWAVFDVSDRHADDHAYFAPLRAELQNGGPAALLAWLQAYDLSSFNVRAAPQTSGLLSQKLASLRGMAKWWLERLGAGELGCRDGYGDDWQLAPVTVLRAALRSEYAAWIKERKFEGELIGDKQFGALLRKMTPGVADKRGGEHGVRVREYVLPALEQCRREFEGYIRGSIDWSE